MGLGWGASHTREVDDNGDPIAEDADPGDVAITGDDDLIAQLPPVPSGDGPSEAEIVDLQVQQLAGRVAERGIEIELTDDARTLLGNLGYDPTYGARPLKRVIQKRLIDKLALKLLEGEFGEGQRVRVDAEGGELVFRPAPKAVASTDAA